MLMVEGQMIKDQLASRALYSEQSSTRENLIAFMKKQHEQDPERINNDKSHVRQPVSASHHPCLYAANLLLF